MRFARYTLPITRDLSRDKESFYEYSSTGYFKIYGAGESQVTALNHASMTIHSGDFISIIGPSGSGKSTLLHIVSGLDKPTSGSVYYGDTDIHNGSDKQLSAFRRQKIGFIFQQFNLLPVLTARENIIMPLLLDKSSPTKNI